MILKHLPIKYAGKHKALSTADALPGSLGTPTRFRGVD